MNPEGENMIILAALHMLLRTNKVNTDKVTAPLISMTFLKMLASLVRRG